MVQLGGKYYTIFCFEFGIPRKLVWLIKMCLNETYSRVHTGKNLSNKFLIQNGLKQGNALSPLLFNFRICYQEVPRKLGRTGIEWGTSFWPMLMTLIFLGQNIDTIQKNTEALLDARKEVGLEVNPEETVYFDVT
jgi:hypothetical protein